MTGVIDLTIFSSVSNSLLLYSSKRFFMYSVAGLFKFRLTKSKIMLCTNIGCRVFSNH